MKKGKTILGVGNPIMDVSASTTNDVLQKYGLEFGRTVFADEKSRPFFDEIEKQSDCAYVPGGSVTNSIRVANWMLKGNKDYHCSIIGCVGDDDYGKNMIKALEDVNVNTIIEINKEYKTSRCGVGVYLKERCLLPEILASNYLSEDFIVQNLEKVLSHDLIFIEGYFVKEKYDKLLDLSKLYTQENKKVALTLSAVFMIEYYYDLLKGIADLSDLIICNDEEAKYFSGNKDEECIDEVARKIHKKLQVKEGRLLIITQGKRPTHISQWNNKENNFDFVLNSYVYPIDDSQIVDTNGCGDAFVGGFLSQYIQDKPLEQCARAGNWSASVIIKNIGCTYPKVCEFN
jgi:adenosine kinase